MEEGLHLMENENKLQYKPKYEFFYPYGLSFGVSEHWK